MTTKAFNQLVSFFIPGEPRPKQSFRASRTGGYQPARVKAWQTEIAIEAELAMREIGRFAQPFDIGNLAVSVDFFLGNNRRVDLDNLSKAVLDGLNKICFGDDRQIVDLHLKKYVIPDKANVGVQVTVLRAEHSNG